MHGVLLLDELAEFERHVLEVLLKPLESGRITISRATRRADFRAQFQLLAAMNPCPCGYFGHYNGKCRCTPDQIARYRGNVRSETAGMIDRRRFLAFMGKSLLASLLEAQPGFALGLDEKEYQVMHMERPSRRITLFLCGDVMTGRGIDQILPHPGKPHLFESYMRSAPGYVELAEKVSGRIRHPVDFAYIWGDALGAFQRSAPDLRIINLETAVTTSEDAWPNKGIHYRMHPANLSCLTAAGIDCCVLANNHVMDWGYKGLAETLDSLHRAGIGTCGAGRNVAEAAAPAILNIPNKGRVRMALT